jgi:hypothetical protein
VIEILNCVCLSLINFTDGYQILCRVVSKTRSSLLELFTHNRLAIVFKSLARCYSEARGVISIAPLVFTSDLDLVSGVVWSTIVRVHHHWQLPIEHSLNQNPTVHHRHLYREHLYSTHRDDQIFIQSYIHFGLATAHS